MNLVVMLLYGWALQLSGLAAQTSLLHRCKSARLVDCLRVHIVAARKAALCVQAEALVRVFRRQSSLSHRLRLVSLEGDKGVGVVHRHQMLGSHLSGTLTVPPD